jgi:hypothetical protein
MAASERPVAAMTGVRPAVRFAAVAIASCLLHAMTLDVAMAQAGGISSPPILINAGFESEPSGPAGNPEGWRSLQHAGDPSYKFEQDGEVRHSGDKSLRISNIGREPFGSIYQTLPATTMRGRTVQLAAWLLTEGASGNRFGKGASLHLQAMKAGHPIAHNHGRDQAAIGTSDWTRREITLHVPADAEQLELGVTLFGPGRAWVDDFVLTVVPAGN